MAKNYFSSIVEVQSQIYKAPNNFLHAAIFFNYSKQIEVGGLSISKDGGLNFDYLPTNGYSDTYIHPEDFNKNIYVLKNLPLDYKDAVFISDKEEVLALNFETLEAFKCKIRWECHGYYSIFRIIYSDGVEDLLSASDYMKTYCFLK